MSQPSQKPCLIHNSWLYPLVCLWTCPSIYLYMYLSMMLADDTIKIYAHLYRMLTCDLVIWSILVHTSIGCLHAILWHHPYVYAPCVGCLHVCDSSSIIACDRTVCTFRTITMCRLLRPWLDETNHYIEWTITCVIHHPSLLVTKPYIRSEP